MRRLHCLGMLNRVKDVTGDVIELGVGFGGTSIPLALWMLENTLQKRLFVCDTFHGLPHSEGDLQAGEWNFGDSFIRAIEHLPLGNVRVMCGRIEETLPKLTDVRFCFAWLDLDLYLPTSAAAEWLTDRIVPGGIIGFHDYGFERCPGIENVVDQEIDLEKYERLLLADSCVFFRRRSE